MDRRKLTSQIDEWIFQKKDEYINDVLGAIDIPSVSSSKEGNFPYGRECALMLDYMEGVCKKYGFECENHQYHCVSTLIPGITGEKEISLIGHTDVVPAGEGWTIEPFKGQVIDGYFAGRGSNDNKGSCFAALYAARFLKENNIKLKSNLQVIFGSDEEAGMKDIKYFYQHNIPSDVALVVDSWFPVSLSERGSMKCTIAANITEGNLLYFKAGDSASTIPNIASCAITGFKYEDVRALAGEDPSIKVEGQGELVIISATGVGKIVFFPDGSVNAIDVLAKFLLDNSLVTGTERQVLEVVSGVLRDYEGKSIGMDYRDDFAGKTVHSLTRIHYERGEEMILQSICCLPCVISYDYDALFQQFLSVFDAPFFSLKESINNKPHFADDQSPVIEIMCRNSEEVLGAPQEVFSQWGGTYTWHVPNSFAVGPAVRGRPQQLFKEPGYGGAHEPNECMEIEVLLNGIKIYILSLLEIDKALTATSQG